MLIRPEGNRENTFHCAYGSRNVQHDPVGMGGNYLESVAAHKILERGVILFRRAETHRKFLRSQIFMKVRARRVINLLE